MTEDADKFRSAVAAASDEYDADIYIYSGSIDDNGLGLIAQAITQHKHKDNAILILTTTGGAANAGYQIARIFQKMYERFFCVCSELLQKRRYADRVGGTSSLS